MAVANNATKVRGRLAADPRAQDDSLGVLLGKQLEHLVQGEGTADVGVEDEQPLGLALEDGITEVVQATGGAEGLVFAQVFDGEVGEGGRGVLDEVAEDGLVVVADEVDFVYGRHLGDGGQAVVDDGVASDIEEGLWHNVSINRRVATRGHRDCIRRTLGTSRERGRNRVPREAPPTCQSRFLSVFLVASGREVEGGGGTGRGGVREARGPE